MKKFQTYLDGLNLSEIKKYDYLNSYKKIKSNLILNNEK